MAVSLPEKVPPLYLVTIIENIVKVSASVTAVVKAASTCKEDNTSLLSWANMKALRTPCKSDNDFLSASYRTTAARKVDNPFGVRALGVVKAKGALRS